MKTIKQIRKALLLITLAIQSLILSINPANADVMAGVNTPCVPEARKLKTHGSLTIDHSHASDGYIIEVRQQIEVCNFIRWYMEPMKTFMWKLQACIIWLMYY